MYLLANGIELVACPTQHANSSTLRDSPNMTIVQRAPGTTDHDVDAKLARLVELEATMSVLRHDLRGMLAPALLVVDRLLAHSDPKVAKAGETVVKAIKRAEERLVATRLPAKQRLFG